MKASAMAFVALTLIVAQSGAQAPRQRPPAASTAASYETRVIDLSRVLGGAHYLRILCRGRGDQTWRDAMTRLIDIEAPVPGGRRSAMAEAFNAGYRVEEERFPACSPEAAAVESALKAKGRRLSSALAAPHRED
jgi:uncharacterized protein (TIGR02301 family)